MRNNAPVATYQSPYMVLLVMSLSFLKAILPTLIFGFIFSARKLQGSANILDWLYIYIYMVNFPYSLEVVTPMCVSLDLRHIWSSEVYVDVVYDHTKSSRVVCISSMQVYMKYIHYYRTGLWSLVQNEQ